MVKSNLLTGFASALIGIVFLCSCNGGKVTPPVIGSIDILEEGEPEYVNYNNEKEISLADKKRNLVEIYEGFVGVREKTGNNDGSDVERFLAHEGLGKGYAWCAAFASFCLDSAGFENGITAWSPTAENKKALVYKDGHFSDMPEPGHVFTLYYPKKKRIGHTGFFNGWADDNIIETVEGNTNDKKSREGDGVYIILRPIGTIHSISSWYE
ncbi:CHAP domain-containing protein [bacterium]|nr:CHAP domain-containing protein [bacterium]NDD82939.1 CHAP domain-containing protein [bacterium]NDG29857.1 CHAP domain-containing protein [bacterium]